MVLFVAAALKGYQLATGPVLGDDILSSRPFLIGLVQFEWVFGLCMLFGLYPKRTWQVALMCFSVFACASLYKGLAGDASCNCFGRLEVSPWYTLALDVVAVLALLLWPPRDRAPGDEPDCGDPNALCCSSRQTPHHITKRPVIESLRFDPDAIHKRRRFFQIFPAFRIGLGHRKVPVLAFPISRRPSQRRLGSPSGPPFENAMDSNGTVSIIAGAQDRTVARPAAGSLCECRHSSPWQISCFLTLLLTLAGCSGGTETSEQDLFPARLAALGRTMPLQIDAREHPLQISPRGGFEHCVTDEQLVTALSASLPLWEPPSVPTLFHELRLWRVDASFPPSLLPEREERSGEFMAATLLSDALCKERTVSLGRKDYIIDSPYGFHVVQSGTPDSEHYRGEGHYGQLLQVMAEAAVPLSTPVQSCTGKIGTIQHLLQDATMRYSPALEQDFMFALALWLPPGETQWSNQHRNVCEFDDIVNLLLAKPLGEGACGGTHAVYCVTILLRVHDEQPILSVPVRSKAMQWLANVAAILEKTQKPEGGWDKDWPSSDTIGFIYGDRVLDSITVTGHHLEWMAYAPDEVQLSRRTIENACASLDVLIRSLPAIENRSFKTVLPCSHAARALCALRTEQPSVLFHRFWQLGLKKTSHGFALKE